MNAIPLPISSTSVLPVARRGAGRRRAGRVGCFALVVVAHLGALGLLERSHAELFGGSGGEGPAGRTAVLLVSAADAALPRWQVLAAPTTAASTVKPGRLPLATRSRSRPLRLQPTHIAPSRPAGEERRALPEAVDEPNRAQFSTAHFYTFDEVELPATPASDWELDAATLDSARIERLVFDLFISDEGKVVACSIVEPPTLDESLRTSLEARLRATVLLPAVRTGRAVDSVRRIELTVS